MTDGSIRRVIEEMITCLRGSQSPGYDRTGLPAVGDHRSLFGMHLDNARLELEGQSCEWARTVRAETPMNRRALCILLWGKLDADEQAVIWFRNIPAGTVSYQTSIYAWQLRDDDDYKKRDPKFDDKVIVERRKPQFSTLAQVGTNLGHSGKWAWSREREAMSKIEMSQEYRILRAEMGE